VTDAPSPGELSRRIDQVTMSLTQLVQRTEYTADRRFDERRFADLEADLTEMRRQHIDEIKALRASIDAATEKRGNNLRQAVYAGILPAVLVLMGIVVQIWLARQGA
jgi:transposase